MENYKLYKVGGIIRDGLLGIPSKDIDYSFIFEDIDLSVTADEYFIKMKNILIEKGVTIYQERPDCFTIRGRLDSEDVDFVMGRRETYPHSDSRIPEVVIGNLYDELARRDFTMNAIAQDEDGNLIDPFNGQKDIQDKIIRCPIDAETSFNDDPLRMLRALRFSITKGFGIPRDITDVINEDTDLWSKFSKVVSQERIREEVCKMMKHDSIGTIRLLSSFDDKSSLPILEKIFAEGMWLKPTTEKK